MVGGPSQPPQMIGEKWAVYYCIACQNYFPYPKSYTGHPSIQGMYQNILSWCEARAQEKKQQQEHAEKLVSIIDSNRDLLGLPTDREDSIEEMMKPLVDRIDDLERQLRAKKGGRPKHCKVKDCKVKAEYDGYCKAHFKELG